MLLLIQEYMNMQIEMIIHLQYTLLLLILGGTAYIVLDIINLQYTLLLLIPVDKKYRYSQKDIYNTLCYY